MQWCSMAGPCCYNSELPFQYYYYHYYHYHWQETVSLANVVMGLLAVSECFSSETGLIWTKRGWLMNGGWRKGNHKEFFVRIAAVAPPVGIRKALRANFLSGIQRTVLLTSSSSVFIKLGRNVWIGVYVNCVGNEFWHFLNCGVLFLQNSKNRVLVPSMYAGYSTSDLFGQLDALYLVEYVPRTCLFNEFCSRS